MRSIVMSIALVFGCAIGCTGCPPFPPPDPMPGPTTLDAGGVVPVVDAAMVDTPIVMSDCQTACANMYELGCAEALKHGKDVCVNTCEHIQRTRFTNLDVKCLMKAETVYAIKQCGIACPKWP